MFHILAWKMWFFGALHNGLSISVLCFVVQVCASDWHVKDGLLHPERPSFILLTAVFKGAFHGLFALDLLLFVMSVLQNGG